MTKAERIEAITKTVVNHVTHHKNGKVTIKMDTPGSLSYLFYALGIFVDLLNEEITLDEARKQL